MNQFFISELTEKLSNVLLGEKLPLDIVNVHTGELIIPARRKITKTLCKKLALKHDVLDIDPSPIKRIVSEIIAECEAKYPETEITIKIRIPRNRNTAEIYCEQMKYNRWVKENGIGRDIKELVQEYQDIQESN